MVPIFSRSGGWHGAGSGAVGPALAWSAVTVLAVGPARAWYALWPLLMRTPWTAWSQMKQSQRAIAMAMGGFGASKKRPPQALAGTGSGLSEQSSKKSKPGAELGDTSSAASADMLRGASGSSVGAEAPGGDDSSTEAAGSARPQATHSASLADALHACTRDRALSRSVTLQNAALRLNR